MPKTANYRVIPELLRNREAFTGNTMRAIRCEGADRDGDRLAHMGEMYRSDFADELRGRSFDYVVFSYSTPIAAVTTNGEVIHNHASYSRTTSRHQGLTRAYL